MAGLRRVFLCMAFVAAAAQAAAASDGDAAAGAMRRGDYPAAVALLRPLAETGDARAQLLLGALHRDGRGVAPDAARAVELFIAAAEQGDARAQANLGEALFQGRGTPRDRAEAFRWFAAAAAQGDVQAQRRMAQMLLNGVGVAKDVAAGFRWLLLWAGQDPEAVRASLADLEDHAIADVLKDMVAAQNTVGLRYLNGDGVETDDVQAVAWFRRAAAQGNTNAQLNMGYVHVKGRGVSVDEAEALRWTRMAAEAGNEKAQYNLALMYQRGQGVERDLAQAFAWAGLAATSGQEEAKRLLNNTLKTQMTHEQLAEGARRLVQLQFARRRAARQGGEATPAVGAGALPLRPAASASVPEMRSPTPSQSATADAALTRRHSGSGFAVSRGHLVTSQQVVTPCRELRSPRLGALRMVGEDAGLGLALLAMTGFEGTAARLRDGDGVRPGDPVVVVGYPLTDLFGDNPSVGTGTVSALNGLQGDTRFLTFSAPVARGGNGGPVLDAAGHVVGVADRSVNPALAMMLGVAPQSINLAVNVDALKGFLDARGVAYVIAPSTAALPAADVAAAATAFTVAVECWN